MQRNFALSACLVLATLLGLAPLLATGTLRDPASRGGAGTRAQIKAVGSSTVYPFTTIVAERFLAANPTARAPVIESTGTGAGIRLFCAGIGAAYPDLADASRRMHRGEYDVCARNGAGALQEMQIGIDGVAFAEAKDGPKLALTPADLYRALAAAPGGRTNMARTWQDVNPALPAVPIQVYGPPATSGTRDALSELILARGCETVDPRMAPIRESRPEIFAARCTRVREDGAYVDAGENDNLIVQKLQANPDAIGVFGYSYLEENADALSGVPIAGVLPTYDTIADGTYPGARPLYLYVKQAHLAAIPGLRAFLRLYTQLWGRDGPLVRRGLIATPTPVAARSATALRDGVLLDPAELR